jgi:hypothetical protein
VKDYEWRHVLQLIVQLARLKLSGAMMGDIFTEIMMINIRNRVSKWMKWMMAWFYVPVRMRMINLINPMILGVLSDNSR